MMFCATGSSRSAGILLQEVPTAALWFWVRVPFGFVVTGKGAPERSHLNGSRIKCPLPFGLVENGLKIWFLPRSCERSPLFSASVGTVPMLDVGLPHLFASQA